MVRTRFAPSPTGFLHVGGLRTALYAYLFAKLNGGQFLLRIEDTDRERFVEGGVENILHSLYWAGVVPDEGVVLGSRQVIKSSSYKIGQIGEKGPYIQSERLPIYQKYAGALLEKGHAYYCFCSSERLDQLRAEQQKKKQPSGYDQFCLKNVSYEDAKKRVAAGEKHVVRLKMPKTGETTFNDLVRGQVSFKNALVDDQVLIKSDGFPTYHLAVVVDDHLMEISHVIRGEEWISSTPKHVQLYQYFGWQAPEFAHLPLLLNPDKSKLSKRQGDVAVSDYEAKGYLPEALVNFVAFLGWNPGDNREMFTLEELVKEFKIGKINKTGAVFNLEKLDWYNREHIKRLSDEELAKRTMLFFEKEEFYKKKIENGNLKLEIGELAKVVKLERERITTLSELPEALKFVFELSDYAAELLIWKKGSREELKKILPGIKDKLFEISEAEWNRKKLEEVLMAWIRDMGYGTGNVLWPMRVALSGLKNSPGPFEIAEVLGKSETIERLARSSEKID